MGRSDVVAVFICRLGGPRLRSSQKRATPVHRAKEGYTFSLPEWSRLGSTTSTRQAEKKKQKGAQWAPHLPRYSSTPPSRPPPPPPPLKNTRDKGPRSENLTGDVELGERLVSADSLHEEAALVVVDVRRAEAERLQRAARVSQVATDDRCRLVHLRRNTAPQHCQGGAIGRVVLN